MKRHQENSGLFQGYGKRRRGGDSSTARVELGPGMVELRFLLTNSDAGAIIGSRGAYIQSLREKYNATISVKGNGVPERILTIACKPEVIKDCCNDVLQKLSEENRTSEKLQLRMLVHLSHSGAIIGHGGSRINQFRKESGLQIRVFGKCCPNSADRIIRFIGSQEKICEVVQSFTSFLQDIPIEGAQRRYDPAYYDPDVANDYGGFDAKEYSAYNNGAVRSRGEKSFGGSYPDSNLRTYGYIEADRNFGQSAPMRANYEVVSEQFSIPEKLGGIVIGEGGRRIRSARQESGAQIDISNANEENDRIITVTGTSEQNQTALYMLQQSIRSSELGKQYLEH